MPSISEIDRVRLAEAFRLADRLQDQVWPEWHTAPFAVLLVTPEYEFLVRHPQPSEGFLDAGYDRLLQSRVHYRKRQFDTHLLATFPAVNGLSTVVIGQAENTVVKTSTPWVVTLLHEHFHQLQDSQPGMYEEMAALGLAHGDETGMWMLNYPFPYTRPDVNAAFSQAAQALLAALQTAKWSDLADKIAIYRAAEQKFREVISEEEYRYMQFQLWKEGVARYTEYQVALQAALLHQPGKGFSDLSDYTPYVQVAADLHQQMILDRLSNERLEHAQRGLFYASGAAQALLLDRAVPDWKRRYLHEKCRIDLYFDGR